MTDISPTLQGIIDHFSPLSDRVSGQPPTPFPKVGEPLSIISNSTANLDDRYTQLLGWDVYVPDLPKQPTRQCTPKYVVNECECGRHIVPSVCMCKDCTTCAPWIKNRTAEAIFRRFLQRDQIRKLGGNDKQVCYTVFTIPPHLRDKFLDPKAIQKVRKSIWVILKTKFGALFGVEATHPIGSESTMFHPHLNFVWSLRKGFRPYIDTHLLQVAWANILDVRVVDVWHQYSDNSNQIFKWCEYVGRPFPGYTWWQKAIRWYGKYPKVNVNSEWICPDCGCYYRRVGTILASVVSDYYAHGWLMGLDPPWYSNTNLTLCRGSKTHGTDAGLSEGSLLRAERACIPAPVIAQGDRRYMQRSFSHPRRTFGQNC